MALVEDHDVIQAFATDRTDHALDVRVRHGERGAVTTSVTPIAATRLLKTEPYEASRSRRRNLGAVSHGNASTTCCESHAAVGCA